MYFVGRVIAQFSPEPFSPRLENLFHRASNVTRVIAEVSFDLRKCKF